MMTQEISQISIGEITTTQGHRGEVRVLPLTDFPERFTVNACLIMEKAGEIRRLTIEKVRPHKNLLIIKFKEIPDMNSAEEIKGGVLKITKDELRDLPKDTYYIFDIIGMKVETEEGLNLGIIKDVIQTGSNDVYVVAGETKQYLIPALKDIVRSIDKNKKMMVIKPLDGLLDL